MKRVRNIRFQVLYVVAALLLAGGVASYSAAPAEAQVAVLADARIGDNGDHTRFVLEFDRAVPYRIFTLSNPDRVVIDLPSVEWNGPASGRDEGAGLIEGYRHGLFRPGVMRVVMDLGAPAEIHRHFALDPSGPYGPRVVVDLVPAAGAVQNAEDFQSAGWDAYSSELSEAVAPQPPVSDGSSSQRIVVLDPGHGGVDPGAIGTSGAYEKVVVLSYSRILREVLQASGRYHVVMTRDSDVYLPLRDRYQVAHSVDAGLFLSIHADAHSSASVRGMSVYTLSDRASDAEAEALAQRENLSDVLAGTDLTGYESDVSSILISLAQRSTRQHSSEFAEILVDEMDDAIRMLRNPHRYAGFAVLKSPNVPSVLIELGYMSNRQDEAELRTENYQRLMARHMLLAIDRYFDEMEARERS